MERRADTCVDVIVKRPSSCRAWAHGRTALIGRRPVVNQPVLHHHRALARAVAGVDELLPRRALRRAATASRGLRACGGRVCIELKREIIAAPGDGRPGANHRRVGLARHVGAVERPDRFGDMPRRRLGRNVVAVAHDFGPGTSRRQIRHEFHSLARRLPPLGVRIDNLVAPLLWQGSMRQRLAPRSLFRGFRVFCRLERSCRNKAQHQQCENCRRTAGCILSN